MAQDDGSDDDKLPPLGEDTKKYLGDAKKGKPRSFLLVCHGAKIRYLAVKKKPVKPSELNEARKSGYKGDGYFGVITGHSMQLVFNLAKSDGYEKEPVKEKVLRDFLEEHAELKAKPTFALVETPPVIPFDDEDLANPLIARFMGMGPSISQAVDTHPDREAELQSRVTAIRGLLQDESFDAAKPKIDELETFLAGLSGPPSPPPPPPPPIPDAEMLRFTARLKAIKPEIDQAIAANNTAGEEIKLRVGESAAFAKKKEFGEANRVLDQVERLLKPAPTADSEAARFTTRLKTLKPDIDAALASPNASPDLKLRVSEAAVCARKKDFAQANLLLDQVETLLKPPTAPVGSAGDLGAQFTSRLKALKPQLDQVLAAGTPASQEVKLRASEAATFARKKDFAEAIRVLDEVETLVSQAVARQGEAESKETESSESGGEGEAAWKSATSEFPVQRKVIREWLSPRLVEFEKLIDRATDLADGGNFAQALATLDGVFPIVTEANRARTQADIGDTVPDGVVAFRKALLRWNRAIADVTTELRTIQTAMRKKLPQAADLADGVEVVLEQFNVGLDDLLRGGMNAKDEASRKPYHDSALQMIRDFQTDAGKSELIKHLDACDFVSIDLKGILTTALGELETQLAS